MTSEEIKKAMLEFKPVVCRGIEYQKINAYIYRVFVNQNTGERKEIFQLELQDKRGNSVTIASVNDVTLKTT